MSRLPANKPGDAARLELLERRLADLERRTRSTVARGGGPPAEQTAQVVQQTAHGLSVGQAVRHNGSAWVAAKADTAANAVVGGIVVAVLSPDVWVLATSGYVAGLSGLTAGSVHYLSAATAGALTTTAPTIQIPIVHADTTTSGILLSMTTAPLAAMDYSTAFEITTTSGLTITMGTATALWFELTGGGGGGGAGVGSSPVSGWYAGGGGGASGTRLYIGPIATRTGNYLRFTRGAGGIAGNNGGQSTLKVDTSSSDSTNILPGGPVTAPGGLAGMAAEAVNTASDDKTQPGNGGSPGNLTGARGYPSRAQPGSNGRTVYATGTYYTAYVGMGNGGILESSAGHGNGGAGGAPSQAAAAGSNGGLWVIGDGTFSLA